MHPYGMYSMPISKLKMLWARHETTLMDRLSDRWTEWFLYVLNNKLLRKQRLNYNTLPKNYIYQRTRGPWATSLTWEISSNQWIHLSEVMIKYIINWPSSSGKDFKISTMYFCSFVIISQCKKVWPFHLNKLQSSFTQRCFLPSLVDIAPVVL